MPSRCSPRACCRRRSPQRSRPLAARPSRACLPRSRNPRAARCRLRSRRSARLRRQRSRSSIRSRASSPMGRTISCLCRRSRGASSRRDTPLRTRWWCPSRTTTSTTRRASWARFARGAGACVRSRSQDGMARHARREARAQARARRTLLSPLRTPPPSSRTQRCGSPGNATPLPPQKTTTLSLLTMRPPTKMFPTPLSSRQRLAPLSRVMCVFYLFSHRPSVARRPRPA
mmetsp:Transcript_9315/g.38168  ORF Transcript_9315/g.38168 Transcript_9315/m.38168 type:complete len:230 (+) Transcript_9315:353-1042(+)